MLKKTINYVDYDGNDRKVDCWFNLSKAEIMEMEIGTTGGLKQMLENVVNEQDIKRIGEILKDIVLRSYGKKSADGTRFEKVIDGKRLSDDFVQTEAYSELYVELLTKDNAFSEFVNGIVPQVMAKELAANPQLMESNT